MNNSNYLESIIKQYSDYKILGDKTFSQMSDEDLLKNMHEDVNSVATIVKHMHGNMMSRWTNFLSSDGEKNWRNRDSEFHQDVSSRYQLLTLWEEGWNTLFSTLENLTNEDLAATIYIRNMGHTVTEAINRQLAHYA